MRICAAVFDAHSALEFPIRECASAFSSRASRALSSGHLSYATYCFCFFLASFLATNSPAYLTPLPLYGSGGR